MELEEGRSSTTGQAFFAFKGNHAGFVLPYDKADTFVVRRDFMHLSFFKDDFREFVDTLQAAVREIDKRESPMAHIHPVMVREAGLAAVESEE